MSRSGEISAELLAHVRERELDGILACDAVLAMSVLAGRDAARLDVTVHHGPLHLGAIREERVDDLVQLVGAARGQLAESLVHGLGQFRAVLRRLHLGLDGALVAVLGLVHDLLLCFFPVLLVLIISLASGESNKKFEKFRSRSI